MTERGRAFSVQQCLLFAGFGLGLGIGGLVGATLGWRAAFLVVSVPGAPLAGTDVIELLTCT